MKIHIQPPQSGTPERAFFDKYAATLPTIGFLVFGFMAVAGLTESGSIYLLINGKTSEVFNPSIAFLIATVCTVFLVISIQSINHTFIPKVWRAIWEPEYRKGPHLIPFIFACLLSFFSFTASVYFSWKGSHDIVNVVSGKPVPPTLLLDSLEKSKSSQLQAVAAQFSRDSANLALQAASTTALGLSAANSQVKSAEKVLSVARQRKTGIGDAQIALAQAQAKADALKLELQSAISGQIAELQAARGEKESQVQKLFNAQFEQINGKYSEAVAAWEGKNQKTGFGLAIVSMICLGFIVGLKGYSVYIRFKSGIMEIPQPHQSFFSQGVIASFIEVRKERFNVWAYGKIHAYASKTEEMPEPLNASTLYTLDLNQVQETKQVIGFKSYSATNTGGNPPPPTSTAQQGGVVGGHVFCACGCGQTFVKSRINHKYLNDQHRLAHHAQNNGGTAFQPGWNRNTTA